MNVETATMLFGCHLLAEDDIACQFSEMPENISHVGVVRLCGSMNAPYSKHNFSKLVLASFLFFVSVGKLECQR